MWYNIYYKVQLKRCVRVTMWGLMMRKNEYLQAIEPHYQGYQELHIHTEASFRDAVNSVQDVADTTMCLGRNAFALTDHGNQMRLFHGFKARTKAEKAALKVALNERGIDNRETEKILAVIGATDSIRAPTEKMWPWIEKYGECFVQAVKKSPQYIPGIELYFQPKKSQEDKSAYHLILYAKDWAGQKALFLIENLAQLNKNKSGSPRTTWADLERFVGPGTLGHGRVIATSACMSGYIPSILLQRWNLADKQNQLQSKLAAENLPYDQEDGAAAEQVVKNTKNALAEAKRILSAAKKAAKTDYTLRLQKLRDKVAKLADIKEMSSGQLSFDEGCDPTQSIKFIEAKERLEEMERKAKECENAKAHMWEYIRDVEACKVNWESAKEHYVKIQKALRPYQNYQNAFEAIEQEKNALGNLQEEAQTVALRFEELFGKGNFYIELQNHNIVKEAVARKMLYDLIRRTGIPPTVANDVHYCRREDKRKRDIISAMRFNQLVSEFENEEGLDQLYFKSNEEMRALSDDELWLVGMENTNRIAEACNVYYDKRTHLPTFDAKAAGFPSARAYLEDFCRKMIPKKYPISSLSNKKRDTLLQEIEKRMRYEFDVIDKMGYTSYIAIVQDFIFYGRQIGGQTAIGPGRGSAAGSIVCYLANITDIDPLRYGLLFERFLNPDRVSMPDIDTDIAGAVRGKVIDYVSEKYSYKGEYPCEELRSTVCNIVTESVLAPRAAVRAVARVTNVPYDVTDRLAKMIPEAPKMTLDKATKENPEIMKFCQQDERAQKLFEEAKLVEGTPVQTGVHAAGVIIADRPVSEYAPLLWNDEKNCWVIECDMIECEATLGLLKMDFLGLTTLDILGTAIFYVRKTQKKRVCLTELKPADDVAVIQSIYAEGHTDGVFQFESEGIKKALVNFRPHSIDDVILMNAAYRPGPMDSIPEFTQVKLGQKAPVYLVPEMESILGRTYGSAIYQEQIMQLFQMVGFSLGEADIIRRAMSKKHLEEIEAAKDKFVNGMKAKGAAMSAIDSYWTRLLAFASYAFNASHAAAYSILSYYTAWMKYYFPCEFMAAQMSYTSHDKIPLYNKECRRLGIQIQKPDINAGVPFFAPNIGKKSIRYGLASIKGVANSAQTIYDLRMKYGKCVDLKDFVLRCMCFGVSSDTMSALCNSGALDCIIIPQWNRRQIAKAFGYKEVKGEQANAQLLDAGNAAIKAVRKSYPEWDSEQVYQALLSGEQAWEMPLPLAYEAYPQEGMLEKEYELLNIYASGDPLTPYMDTIQAHRTKEKEIGMIEVEGETDVSLVGLLHSIQIQHRKSDGAAFARFILEDETGQLHCIVFTAAFARLRNSICEKAVVRVRGRINEDSNSGERTLRVASVVHI